MDIGDLVRLIFLAFIFLSFFGGLFGRKSGEERKRAPRPRDISQSGGEPPMPRPQPQTVTFPAPEPAAHEQRWEAETLAHPERHVEEVRERYGTQRVETYDDAIEAGGAARRARLEQARRRYGHGRERDEILEQDIRMDVTPEHVRRQRRRPAVSTRRHHPATGGDVLRRSLKDPDTLERSFIVKEVLDIPVGMRESR